MSDDVVRYHPKLSLASGLVPRGVVSLVLLAGAVQALSGRQATQAPPLFRSSVELVHLDVSVLDRDRRPVRGLTPADFTVFENGVPQKIAVFTAVDLPGPPPASGAAWLRNIASDVGANDGMEERRLFLLLIDDAAVQGDVFAGKNVKEIGRKFIEKLGPSDLAAVIFTRDNRNAQDFTSDRTRLLAAVDTFTFGFRDMAGPNIAGADDLYYLYSIGVLESAVTTLSTLPDRRKAIIYIGQGLPVDFGSVSAPAAAGLPQDGGTSALARQGTMGQIIHQMRRAFDRAARANVNVYSLDVCGIRVPPPANARQPTCVPGLEVDYVQTLAENTGGRAVINTNEFTQGIQAIFDENASYYLLGFQPSNASQDGKFRRLDVRVNRPGLDVRTRSGYDAQRPDAARRQAEAAKSPLGAALAGLVPKSDLPLRMVAVPFALPNRSESAVAVMVGIRQPIREVSARTVERVDLQIRAFTPEGKQQGSTALRADVAIRAGASGLAEYEVLSRLDLKPGRYQLRIAANVGSLSTSGSLYYDLDVPDISSAPLSLSALLLTATPGPIVASRGELKDILPVVPTTRRTFAATDGVAAFMRMYQGRRSALTAIDLRLQIRDQDDRTVLDRRDVVPAERFTASRTADVRLEIPVARLPDGQYLLTVTAGTEPNGVTRQIRFEIAR